MRSAEHVCSRNARRKQRTAYDLVPIKANSWLYQQTLQRRPAVFDISPGFQVIAIQRGGWRQYAASIQGAVGAKQQERLILVLLCEVDLIYFSPEFDFVAPERREWIQKQIRDALCSSRRAVELLKIISLVSVGSDHKRIRTLRVVLVTKRIPGETGFKQRSTREIVQFLYRPQVCIEVALHRRR